MNKETTPQQQQAEPVTWDKPSDNFIIQRRKAKSKN